MDSDGTELADLAAAHGHATGVARELTFKSEGIMRHRWADWTMSVHDDAGAQLFSFGMSDFDSGDSSS